LNEKNPKKGKIRKKKNKNKKGKVGLKQAKCMSGDVFDS
jgi:hypothetical protein